MPHAEDASIDANLVRNSFAVKVVDVSLFDVRDTSLLCFGVTAADVVETIKPRQWV